MHAAPGEGRHAAYRHLEAPLRRPLSVAIPTLVALALSVSAGLVLPKRHRASTLIAIDRGAAFAHAGQASGPATLEDQLPAIAVRVLSRSRLEQVVEGLDPYPGSPRGSGPVAALRDASRVRAGPPGTFRVECDHVDPRMAAALSRRLAALFVEATETERAMQSAGGVEALEGRLADARRLVEEREAALVRLAEPGPAGEVDSTGRDLRRLEIERQAIAASLLTARTEVDLLRQAVEQERRAAAAPPAAVPVELEQLRSRLADLRRRYTDRYPDVQAVLRRIRELEAAVPAAPEPSTEASARAAEVERAEARVASLERRAQGADAEIARLRGLSSPAPVADLRRASLEAALAQAKETYLALLQEWTDARVARASPEGWPDARFSVLEPAGVPDRPFFPSLPLFATVGLVVGLTMGFGLAFLREFLDHTVKGPEDLQETLPLPLLAEIPFVPSPRSTPRE
jgi:uncharacterized protein involved in exopolysaccharide biosynthesis